MSWERRFGFRPRDLRHSPTFCGLGSRFQSHQTRSFQPLGSAGAGRLAFRLDLACFPPVKFCLRAAFAQSSRLATIVLLSNGICAPQHNRTMDRLSWLSLRALQRGISVPWVSPTNAIAPDD